MQKTSNQLFRTPFSAAYWRQALADFRTVRVLVFAALMIAACCALNLIPSVPVVPGVKLTSWGYMARALCGLVGGPVTAVVFGVAEDTVSFLIDSGGYPYFPGYALTTAIGTAVYALFLYRTRITMVRVFLAKLLNNVINVLLGSLWSMMLEGEGYLYYVTTRIITNTLRLPFEVIILVLLFSALLPVLRRMKLVPDQYESRRLMPVI